MLQTPVALIIFNRPDTTERVFAEIARARPAKLLVVADGARASHPGEDEKCRQTRAVIERVDWPCEVLTNYSDVNLGCQQRPATGIGWVFEQCEEAIILEDDCVPHPSFFRFCEELLEKYRDDERVPMICGSNFLQGRKASSDSYYFSRIGHIWGWATWRRAWQHMDVQISLWPELKETSWLFDIFRDEAAVAYLREIFDRIYGGELKSSWDYQWFFSYWAQNGLAILPAVNLISNIGFGEEATHTKTAIETMAYLPVAEMDFPLRHPKYMIRDMEDDLFAFRQICPWAVKQSGVRAWLRRNVAPALPASVRKSISQLKPKVS
jgi:hypothetical protein